MPFREGKLGPHLTQCGVAEAYLNSKWHPNQSNRLATIHQRHRQTGQDRQDRQRSDRIWRTVFTNGRPINRYAYIFVITVIYGYKSQLSIDTTRDSKPEMRFMRLVA